MDVIPEKLTVGEPLTTEELIEYLPALKEIPAVLLKQFAVGAAVKRSFRAGDLVCEEGEFGLTAFYIVSGKVSIFIKNPMASVKTRPSGSGFFSALRRMTSFLGTNQPEMLAADSGFIPIDASIDLPKETPLADLGPGELFGEMTCRTFQPRSATVRAIRDSELVRVPKEEFLRLLDEHPRAAIELSRTLVRRLRQTTAAPRLLRHTRTLALVPAHSDGIPVDFSHQLADALRLSDDTVLVLSSAGVDAELGSGIAQTASADISNGRLLDWLNEREERFRYVVYECDAALTPWTQRCLRQADLVLAVARAHDDPEPRDVERALARPATNGAPPPRYELVLLHEPDVSRPSGTLRWLDERCDATLAAHHHVRLGHTSDIERLARSIAGVSLGLVLSGGGARGFAQIGVLRALEEQGLAVDMVGGTSMGAYMAGLHALGLDIATMTEVSRKGFVGYHVVSDLTMPWLRSCAAGAP